jgi:hypothetical protein
MKVLKVILASIPVLLLVLALVAPLGPIPGLFIGGTSAKAPEKWGDTSNADEIMLRVPGTVPRVVIIWVVEHGGELHVVGSRESGWVAMIGAESPVEMRLGDNTYALQATVVTEGWQPILEAYVAKYKADYPDIVADFPSIDEAKDLVAVFRLNRT